MRFRWILAGMLYITLIGSVLWYIQKQSLDRVSHKSTKLDSLADKSSKDRDHTNRIGEDLVKPADRRDLQMIKSDHVKLQSHGKPTKRQFKDALRAVDRHLRTRGKVWGKLSDGSQIIGMRDAEKLELPEDSQQPAGKELWRIAPNSLPQQMASGIKATEVRIADHTERVALVTPEQELYISGTKATEPFERIAEKVDYYPSFSPDGQQIAYVQQPTYDHGTLWLRDLRTGKTRTLDAQAWGLATPFFHPDGHALIFVSSRTGIASLWRIDLPDGKPRQITNIGIEVGSGLPDHFVPPPFMARLIWAGNWIAFDASDSLWILRDDGSMARSIANESPRWFRWYKPGHSVSYQLSSGSQITYNIPAQ